MLATRIRMSGTGIEAGSVVLVDTSVSTSVNSDTRTVNGMNLGTGVTGGNTRHIIAVVTMHDDDYGDIVAVGSATLDGNDFTEVSLGSGRRVDDVGETFGPGSTGAVWIGIIEMSNEDTDADFSFALSGFDGTMDAYGIALYRAINLASATPDSTPTGTSNISLTVPSNGFGVVGAYNREDSGSLGDFSGSGADTAFSGSRAGAVMFRTTAGTVSHDSSNATAFHGATWTFN